MYANRHLLNWLGYTQNELRQQSFFDIMHPEDIQRTLKVAKKLKRNENDPIVEFKNRYRCKNGNYITLSWDTYIIWGWYVAQVKKIEE